MSFLGQRHHICPADGCLPGNVGMSTTRLANEHFYDLRIKKTDNGQPQDERPLLIVNVDCLIGYFGAFW
jgi:hypothetical protein